MRSLAVPAVLLLLIAAGGAQEVPRFEVFGGYSFLHTSSPPVIGDDIHGWEASANYNLNRWFALKADFSGHYVSFEAPTFHSQERVHDFLFGPQFSWRTKRATLFAHALFGVSHFSADAHIFSPRSDSSVSDNAFAVALGGGGDLNLGEHWAWRVAQIDYLRTSEFGTDFNKLRVSTGLVLRFGK